MAVKKSELYSLLWDACNKLRGGVEPSRYKDYVLVLLFWFCCKVLNLLSNKVE
ncbi:type I restriction-modification system subunit M N-terminal domain-containing protein [Aerococcus viridans]